MKYYYDYDEVWGDDPSACVDELNEMEDSTIRTYMTLGAGMYASAKSEMVESICSKRDEILKKHGCYLYPMGRDYRYLESKGLLEKYREYRNRTEGMNRY